MAGSVLVVRRQTRGQSKDVHIGNIVVPKHLLWARPTQGAYLGVVLIAMARVFAFYRNSPLKCYLQLNILSIQGVTCAIKDLC